MKNITSYFLTDIILPKEKEKFEPDEQSQQLISKEWNIRLLYNIGYGGFSIVKLVYNMEEKEYYACKIVILFYITI